MKQRFEEYIHRPLPLSYEQFEGWGNDLHLASGKKKLPEVLFITSYPPRECGIATYSQDLIKMLSSKFDHSFDFSICALESDTEQYTYAEPIKYILNTNTVHAFQNMAATINADTVVELVVLQHEFGFYTANEKDFSAFLKLLQKPFVLVFHTVLPSPDEPLLFFVQEISMLAASVVVMTKSSKKILVSDYLLPVKKILVIPHGTHLVPHEAEETLKEKHNLSGRKILSTFGLLSSGKSIETTLQALPSIIQKNPDVLFLIIGKTHPSVVKEQGEAYRQKLEKMVKELQLEEHVQFINAFLPLPQLLEYLQLTDIYLFTSKDRNQAVSGTFSYAISCGCPIISTPIPHAREVLKNDAGVIIDFEAPEQLAIEVNRLLQNEELRKNMSSNGLHRMASTAWENAAICHARLFKAIIDNSMALTYNLPEIHLQHIKKLTTRFGMIQFAKINQPDHDSGYTVDDNARALIAMCQHFELTRDKADIPYIHIYLKFIEFCQQHDGSFLNYVNTEKKFTSQNYETNLADSNGRSIWALGYLVSLRPLLPAQLTALANRIIENSLPHLNALHSTRAMAFIIKGLYYRHLKIKTEQNASLITELANRLLQMYRHERRNGWHWFESYLTYANSLLPEAMLYAWLHTGNILYKEVAVEAFDFLLSKTFSPSRIKVISNQNWLHDGIEVVKKKNGGEQPIDVAYSILALNKFYDVFKTKHYKTKMDIAFNWFLGANHLHQIIYNPCTGGCYDGLEEDYVNLNQGAESTVSYLMARLTVEKMQRNIRRVVEQKNHAFNFNL
ncbi:glycosyltransferase [Lacibacter sp. H407]|uniref:glycosyltransferase n=1 Tax=Lacibacter sp. H407 TaxID=3133423 RepID=UPI0030BFCD8F